MRPPIKHRNNIPFFHDKSEKEFRQDAYEHYDSMVTRQTALHLTDDLWGDYPMQQILNLGYKHWPDHKIKDIVEIGCSVGRWIGDVAIKHNDANCWGIDYSYQLLKRAHERWISGETMQVDLSRYGYDDNHEIIGNRLSNLQFGLAKAEALPFDDNSQDLVLNSFLFDRLEDPIMGLKEMKRILRPDGRMIMITPLNFLHSRHWEAFYPPVKIQHLLTDMDFEIIDWTKDLKIIEPLDIGGNAIKWKAIGVVCRKGVR